MQQKYGFIYLWYDRKHAKFYLGRHWGHEDDGYICSSVNMRNNYKNRPQDFKRRIVKRVYDSQENLVFEEQRYLNMIKPTECKSRYYNISLKSTIPTMRGRKHSEETKEKMRQKALGRIQTEETKNKLRLINLGKTYSESTNKKKGGHRDYSDPLFREKMTICAKNRTVEHRRKISENNRRLIAEGKIGMKGRTHDEETKLRISLSNRGQKRSEEAKRNMALGRERAKQSKGSTSFSSYKSLR